MSQRRVGGYAMLANTAYCRPENATLFRGSKKTMCFPGISQLVFACQLS